jgi:hypothetical protein
MKREDHCETTISEAPLAVIKSKNTKNILFLKNPTNDEEASWGSLVMGTRAKSTAAKIGTKDQKKHTIHHSESLNTATKRVVSKIAAI